MKVRYLTFALTLMLAFFIVTGWLILVNTASTAAQVADNPVISVVHPNTAPNDLDITLHISGTGFTAVISGSLVITPPHVLLGDQLLTDMQWLSSTLLTATLPWGIEPGVYTMTVVNPDGSSGTLASAYTATQGIGVWNAGELYGGWVEQAVIDPFNPETVYAIAGGVGLFRSLDSGETWSILRPGVGTQNLSASRVLSGRLYTQATWDLRRSDDGGVSWITLNPTFPMTETSGQDCFGYLPQAHPVLTDTVYASLCSSNSPGLNGLLRSDDAGETWREMMVGLTDTQVTAYAFHPTDPLSMYLGTASGRIYTSSNGGESWQYASRPLGFIQQIAVDPFGEHRVWVTSIHGRDTPCATYYSSDDSLTTWTEVNPSTSEQFCRKVIFDPVNQGTIYVPFGYGFKTVDGGESWTEFDLGGENYPIDIAIDPTTPDTLYMTDGARGVYKSADAGESWYESNMGLTAMVPELIEVLPDQPDTLFTVVSNGLYKGIQGGAAWQDVSPSWMSAVWDVLADPFISSRLYVGSLAGMCVSLDAGETFPSCVQLEPPPEYAGDGIWPQTIAADPSQPGNLMVGVRYIADTHFLDEGALYRTTDFGENWTIITSTVGISLPVEIVHDPITPTMVYLVTSSGLLRSLDSGISWQPIAEEITALQLGCTLGIEPVPPGRIITMGMDQGLWVSDDHGDTWRSLPTSPELGINPSALLWLPGEQQVLYGATPTGLSFSLDRGESWERVPGALGYANVTALDAVQVDERTILYAGTTGGTMESVLHIAADEMIGAGVYRYTYTTLDFPVIHPLFIPLVSK